ncbi:MAG: hypothetical protein IID31_13180 [Planctomycetes bacterium]|nr:hypothetical protein [Planctomycetota bacterium]
MKNAGFLAAAACVATSAAAQSNGTYLLTSSNTVSPSSPMTTIGIWAAWVDPGATFVYAESDYDLTASDGEFSNAVNVLNGPGSSTGVIAGNVISGAINRNLLIPSTHPPPPVNPILLATYEWSTTDFRSRTVDLHTSETTVFQVGIPSFLGPPLIVDLFPGQFTPGSGVINVVPAPAAWVVLALPLLASRRRRC